MTGNTRTTNAAFAVESDDDDDAEELVAPTEDKASIVGTTKYERQRLSYCVVFRRRALNVSVNEFYVRPDFNK